MYLTINGRRVLSPEGKRFKSKVRELVDSLRFDGRLSEKDLNTLRSGYLSMFIDFYFPSPLKRDLDGGLKITQDALCESLGINDNRVVDIHLVKRIDPLHPRVYVQLETIPERDWDFGDEYVYTGSGEDGHGPAR